MWYRGCDRDYFCDIPRTLSITPEKCIQLLTLCNAAHPLHSRQDTSLVECITMCPHEHARFMCTVNWRLYCILYTCCVNDHVAPLYMCFMFFSDYWPALSLVRFTSNFFKHLSTFTYSYQESCSLYLKCTPYFSVEHTVSPQSPVSNFSSGCSVEYTIHNLMRCVSYQSTATALLSNQSGKPIVVGDTVMLSEWLQLIYTSLQWGASRLDCTRSNHLT